MGGYSEDDGGWEGARERGSEDGPKNCGREHPFSKCQPYVCDRRNCRFCGLGPTSKVNFSSRYLLAGRVEGEC